MSCSQFSQIIVAGLSRTEMSNSACIVDPALQIAPAPQKRKRNKAWCTICGNLPGRIIVCDDCSRKAGPCCIKIDSDEKNVCKACNGSACIDPAPRKPRRNRTRCKFCGHLPGRIIVCDVCSRKAGPCCIKTESNEKNLCKECYEPDPEPAPELDMEN